MSQNRAVRRRAGAAGGNAGRDRGRRNDEEANDRANEVENPNYFGLILAVLVIVTAFTVFILLMNYHPSLQGDFGPP